MSQSYSTAWLPTGARVQSLRGMGIGILAGFVAGFVRWRNFDSAFIGGFGGLLFGGALVSISQMRGQVFTYLADPKHHYRPPLMMVICLISAASIALSPPDREHPHEPLVVAVILPASFGLLVCLVCQITKEHVHRIDRRPGITTGQIDLGNPGAYAYSPLAYQWLCEIIYIAADCESPVAKLIPQGEHYLVQFGPSPPLLKGIPFAPVLALLGELEAITGIVRQPPWYRRWLRRRSASMARHRWIRVGAGTADFLMDVWFKPADVSFELHIPIDHGNQLRSARERFRDRINRKVESEFQHVCQGSGNCGVASVAIVAGTTYDKVASARSPTRQGRGCRQRELVALLARFTHKTWRAFALDLPLRRLDWLEFPDWPVLVTISPFENLLTIRHVIVVIGGIVHDPAMPEPVKLCQYDRVTWGVIEVLQPVARPACALS